MTISGQPATGSRARDLRRAALGILASLAPGIVLLALWEIGARWMFDPYFVGQPSRIIAAFAGHFVTAAIWWHVWVTFYEVLVGYAIGLVFGVAVGYALGLDEALARVFEPYVLVLNAIPKVAIAPLLIVALGIGAASKIAIVVSLVFFLMFYGVYVGMRTVDAEFIYQARIMGLNRWGEIRYVILPAIMPNVLSAMKASSSYAVIGAVIGEYVAAQAGLGYFILNASGVFNVTDIWVGVAFLMLLLMTMAGLLTWAERRLLRWMPRHKLG